MFNQLIKSIQNGSIYVAHNNFDGTVCSNSETCKNNSLEQFMIDNNLTADQVVEILTWYLDK
jgi:hypothetical protein